MSVQPAPLWVIRIIASDYVPGGRYYGKHLPSDSPISAIVAEDPHHRIHQHLLRALEKKKLSATKMLRLHKTVKSCVAYCQNNTEIVQEFEELLEKEADRLIKRALRLSARHGAKANVRIETLKALAKADFISSRDVADVEAAMMSRQVINDLLTKINSDELLRWKLTRKDQAPQAKPAPKKRKPMICKTSRREAGIKVRKPITKAAFLLLKDDKGNTLPASAKKQEIKDERTAKAQQRRRGFKANGGAKVGSPGEGVTVRQPVLKWCAAGHAGTKVAK